MHELMRIFEVIDRLFVCKVLIRHLEERKETRWRAFQENKDYPEKDDDNFLKFINSRYENGEIKVVFRNLVKRDDIYEHYD
jgi:adenylylsulfate reductase subunit A